MKEFFFTLLMIDMCAHQNVCCRNLSSKLDQYVNFNLSYEVFKLSKFENADKIILTIRRLLTQLCLPELFLVDNKALNTKKHILQKHFVIKLLFSHVLNLLTSLKRSHSKRCFEGNGCSRAYNLSCEEPFTGK